MKTLFSLFLGLLIATGAAAQDTIRIDHAASHSMVPGAKVGDGYLVITNSGSEADRLVAASSDRAGNVQLHQMTMANGIMTMRELKGGLPIPAGQTITLAPNYHLMFQDVAKPFRQGETIRAVLRFEKAGDIPVDFAVGKIAGPLDDVQSQIAEGDQAIARRRAAARLWFVAPGHRGRWLCLQLLPQHALVALVGACRRLASP